MLENKFEIPDNVKMKHHFGDLLDRTYGHWAILPNIERHKYHLDDWSQAQKFCFNCHHLRQRPKLENNRILT
ncbi:hypothetical protein LEP1GSC036_1779 [Leptospira weilii str. 2006001853]|uniref:Uncharacterized protein n=3 Tax=Leptospira weilii TaxID=28184 RepID=A0A828Z246_9LEPT|nr:hypothetical protein LEP1GSC036_1779 [Leptospira weilii str. 2006001853]EMJ63182.1 hypothetical protein LEP1GSC051_1420 [Leptospira sp. P2653]EMM71508.1 hypothetical protein LEP1GSC038_0506 [Leptospira weilii str. 2006001855]EMN42909.1 hypothetical protein LEP1GSC086_1955 [Leptospira weilii str. LNT 1234]EMN91563.1 hypothetical protein LEP1GSC108_4099 [Leptospira weilii str. UI 13098]QDK24996.1 hypothetical protein FHG67_20020 [Leptospira weilii]